MSRVRPLIVGEAPNRLGRSDRPIGGRCGDRLAALSGCSPAAFARAFDRTNVLYAWPGAAGKGAAFPMTAARRRARAIRSRFVRGRMVILLGLRTAAAFGVRVGYFEPVRFGQSDVVVVPHPSGINRWYNDAHNVRRMRAFMRSIARRS